MRSLALVLVLGRLAAADGTTTPVAIAVGETVKRDVGYARGLHCDDVAIVSAEIATDTARDTNVVSFIGLKAGKTLCRAGLEAGRPVVVFEVAVSAKKSLPRR